MKVGITWNENMYETERERERGGRAVGERGTISDDIRRYIQRNHHVIFLNANGQFGLFRKV